MLTLEQTSLIFVIFLRKFLIFFYFYDYDPICKLFQIWGTLYGKVIEVELGDILEF